MCADENVEFRLGLRGDIRQMIAIGQYAEAITHLEREYAEARQQYGKHDLRTADYQIRIAYAQTLAGRLSDAERTLSELLTRIVHANHVDTAIAAYARARLAEVYYRQDRAEEAAALAEAALSSLVATRGERHPDTLEARTTLALALNRIEQYDAARHHLDALVEQYKNGVQDGIDIMQVLWAMSHNASATGDHVRAHAAASQALAASIRRHGHNHKAVAKAYTVLAMVSNAQGDRQRACQHAAKAVDIFEATGSMQLPSAEVAKEIYVSLRARLSRKG